MVTIKSTGNNFGAGEITFEGFLQENYLILNSKVTFDPSNADYQAATQLEIYVPDLPLERSTISGMLMYGTKDGKEYGTSIKTWLKDRNTLVLEKLTYWDDNDTITLVFSNVFIPRNVKGEHIRLPNQSASFIDKVGNIREGQTYWSATDELVFLAITFDEIRQPDSSTPASFKIKDLPDIEDFDGIMISKETSKTSAGCQMYHFTIRDNVFQIELFEEKASRTYLASCGFICYVPKKQTPIEEQ